MGISDLYMSIGQKRNISHFANIVRIAKSDKNISPEEVEFLSRISHKYNISNEQFKQILKEPDKVPTLAHLDCEERSERLYELLQMVEVDHKIEKEEVSMLEKLVIGLAFPLNSVDEIVALCLGSDLEKVSVDEFKNDIFKLLGIKYHKLP